MLFPLTTQHNVENQVKLQVLVFNIVWGLGGEVRQAKLYSRLACAQKRQKCKFVPRLLFMIVVSLVLKHSTNHNSRKQRQ